MGILKHCKMDEYTSALSGQVKTQKNDLVEKFKFQH